jgi:RimJ/RimL family protein N-acetyltransferase
VSGSGDSEVVTTARLQVRPPRETDRARFVSLFSDDAFMVFYPRVFTEAEASDRFDHMLAVCEAVPFGKQPVIESSSGEILGYTGVDYVDFEGQSRLEWGYRLVPRARGRGYATEAGLALLAKAHRTYSGELLAIIDLENVASQNVCGKLGFSFWKQAPVFGDVKNLYRIMAGTRKDDRQ